VQADFESYKAMTHDMLEAKDKQMERLREESEKLQRRASQREKPVPQTERPPQKEVRFQVECGGKSARILLSTVENVFW
jgi:hypothetical protein